MVRVLNISEACSLGVHAAAYLAAKEPLTVTAHDIASSLGVSEAHLSKVLRRLAHSGLLSSSPGPGGGFGLNKPGDEITLLDVYESIDGPLRLDDCLLQTRICGDGDCVFGGLLHDTNLRFRNYLANTSVSEIKMTVRE